MRWCSNAARRQAGDTIVEVLMAIVVISVIIAGAYQVTNQGLRIGQNAIERTQASEVTSGQAEILRTLRDQYIETPAEGQDWETIVNNYASITVPNYNSCTPTTGSSPFYLVTNAGDVIPTSGTHTQGFLQYWIEAYRPSGANYIDFHVRGCWPGIGDQGPQDTGIVVRLLE